MLPIRTTTLGNGADLFPTTSSVKPDQFRSVSSTTDAMNDINHHLNEIPELAQNSAHLLSLFIVDFTANLWSEIDKAISIRDALVYSYISDLSEDPLSEGNMCAIQWHVRRRWSFNYFFYNKETKRMLFIACTAKRNDN